MAELRRRTRGAQVRIDEHFAMWTDYDLEVVGDLSIEFELLLHVRFDQAADRTRIAELSVHRREPDGPDVSGTGLRTLRLQDYVRRARVEVARLDEDGAPVEYSEIGAMIAQDRADEALWKRQRLAWVYRVYRTAHLALRDPAAEVQRVLELPPSTATRWIREARDAGMFPEPGRAELVTVGGVVPGVSFAPTVMRIPDEELHGNR